MLSQAELEVLAKTKRLLASSRHLLREIAANSRHPRVRVADLAPTVRKNSERSPSTKCDEPDRQTSDGPFE